MIDERYLPMRFTADALGLSPRRLHRGVSDLGGAYQSNHDRRRSPLVRVQTWADVIAGSTRRHSTRQLVDDRSKASSVIHIKPSLSLSLHRGMRDWAHRSNPKHCRRITTFRARADLLITPNQGKDPDLIVACYAFHINAHFTFLTESWSTSGRLQSGMSRYQYG